nr:hypothetical protein [uncultured Cupriavidus sp.]
MLWIIVVYLAKESKNLDSVRVGATAGRASGQPDRAARKMPGKSMAINGQKARIFGNSPRQ